MDKETWLPRTEDCSGLNFHTSVAGRTVMRIGMEGRGAEDKGVERIEGALRGGG